MKDTAISSAWLKANSSQAPTVIFGADICGRLIARHLAAQGSKVDTFIDNNSNKCGILLEKLPVKTVDVLSKLPLDSRFLIASTYYNDIFSQLNELGFSQIYPTYSILKEIDKDVIRSLPSLDGQVHGKGNFS